MDAEICFILPAYNRYLYCRRAALSFFQNTRRPGVVVMLDDASPYYDRQDWAAWREGMPEDRLIFKRYTRNGGLTRSWNAGLQLSRELNCRFAVAGNSDVIFTPGWEEGLIQQVENGCHLVGPVTNAPGMTNDGRQSVTNYYPGYKVTDDPVYLEQVASYLRQRYAEAPLVDVAINGFFMFARTDTWHAGAFDSQHVFDPKNKMTGNEDELQKRWKRRGMKIGFTPSSFIFHYRAVTRGDRYKARGWYRASDLTQSP